MRSDETLYVEKYRPQTVAECVLPERIKKIFQSYVDKKDIPNLMLCGRAGVGKTTVAVAMCKEIGLNYLLVNSSKDRGIGTLRTTLSSYASTVSMTGGKKVIILDEADGVTPEAQDALKALIEAYSSNCTFILTCNYKARLIEPLHSRCAVIDFTLHGDEKPQMASQFFKRVSEILTDEGIDFDKQALINVVSKFFPDYRRTLNEVQRYGTLGSIDAGVVAQITDIQKLSELAKFLKDKDFNKMRKWVTNNSDVDQTQIYRRLYDGLVEFLKPESIPQVVVIINTYQYQAAFVADQEINLVACLIQIMIDCEMK